MTTDQTTEREEDVNPSFLTYILLVMVSIFFYGRYMYELPSESTDISALAIIESCGGIEEMSNSTTGTRHQHHLCDPNGLISDKLNIASKITQIESYYDLKYGLSDSISDDATSHSHSVTPAGNLKMTVFVIDKIGTNLPYFSVQDKCEYIAYGLRDALEDDGSSSIVLLLTEKEEGICIACSKEIQKYLTPSRVDDITEQMNSRNWNWSETDLVDGVDYCLKRILRYLEEGEPSFFERYGWFLFCGGYLFFYFTSRNPRSRRTFVNIQDNIQERVGVGNSVIKEMNQDELGEALSLMKRYQCFSCPICLEDYEESSVVEDCEGGNGDNEDYNSVKRIRYLGCDKEPIRLLRCGHSACHSCWEEWRLTGRNAQSCPVCKEDIGG